MSHEERAGRATLACIIPTHNRPDFLRESIRSVLQQADPNSLLTEVIVVSDDGAETTEAVVADFERVDPRVRFVRATETPHGAASSRNIGARLATSSYLAFLDDDDWWREGYLDMLSRILGRVRPDAIFSSVFVADETNKTRTARLVSRESVSLQHAFAAGSVVTGSNIVVSSTAFGETGGYNAHMPVLNDTDFLVRFLQTDRSIELVEEPFVFVRKHDSGQLTTIGQTRADGMRTFYSAHSAQMTWLQRRGFKYRMYGMRRRVTSAGFGSRMFATAQQAFNYLPKSMRTG